MRHWVRRTKNERSSHASTPTMIMTLNMIKMMLALTRWTLESNLTKPILSEELSTVWRIVFWYYVRVRIWNSYTMAVTAWNGGVHGWRSRGRGGLVLESGYFRKQSLLLGLGNAIIFNRIQLRQTWTRVSSPFDYRAIIGACGRHEMRMMIMMTMIIMTMTPPVAQDHQHSLKPFSRKNWSNRGPARMNDPFCYWHHPSLHPKKQISSRIHLNPAWWCGWIG
jgi:hypothetical protein